MGNALLEIIIMLVVSAGLGFAVAWFFQKRKLDKLQELYDQKVSDYNDLDQQHKELQKNNTSLKAELTASQTEINNLNDKIKVLNSELDKTKEDVTRLNNELDTANTSLSKAKEENEKITGEFSSLQSDLKELNNEHAKLKTKLDQ